MLWPQRLTQLSPCILSISFPARPNRLLSRVPDSKSHAYSNSQDGLCQAKTRNANEEAIENVDSNKSTVLARGHAIGQAGC